MQQGYDTCVKVCTDELCEIDKEVSQSLAKS